MLSDVGCLSDILIYSQICCLICATLAVLSIPGLYLDSLILVSTFTPKDPASVELKSTVSLTVTRSIFDEVNNGLIKLTALVDGDVGWLSRSTVLVQSGISQQRWLKSP